MEQMLPGAVIVAVLLTTLVGGMVFVRAMIRVAPALGLVDYPAERRVHAMPVPRAGGIGVFGAVLLGIGLMVWTGLPQAFGSRLMDGRWLPSFLAGATLLVAVGVIDDRWNISAWWKLAAQVLAAVVMFSSDFSGMGSLYGVHVPWWVDMAVHVAWIVALVNAFNLIDGMDGLCAGLGVIALGTLAALSWVGGRPGDALLLGVVMAALLGFLRYNFHPARTFLGDAGSMFIGYFVATAGAQTVGRNAVMAGLLLPLLVAGVPLFDVLLAVWRRGLRRLLVSRPGGAAVRIFGADRDHLHHRLMDRGLGQRRTVVALYLMACVVAVVALIPMLGGHNLVAFTVVGMVVIALVGVRYVASVEIVESAEGLRAVVRRPLGRGVMLLAYFGWDLLVLAGSAWVAIWWVERVGNFRLPAGHVWMIVSIYTGSCLVALRFARAHTRQWTRAGVHDFLQMLAWLLCGVALSGGLMTVLLRDIAFRDSAIRLLAFAMSAIAIVAPRAIGVSVQEGVLSAFHRRRRILSHPGRPTLVYGAGDMGELFLCHMRLSAPQVWSSYRVVGFLDDEVKLKGRRMRGFPILGGLADLASVVETHGVECVILTISGLDPQRRAELLAAAERLRLEVREWLPDPDPRVLREEPSLPPLRPGTRAPAPRAVPAAPAVPVGGPAPGPAAFQPVTGPKA